MRVYYLNKVLSVIAACLLSVHVTAQSYHGFVCDSVTRKPVEYAAVALYRSGQLTHSAITAENGAFKLETPKEAFVLKVSMLGYRTLTKEVLPQTASGDTLFLSPLTVSLHEVEIRAETTEFGIDKDSYIITDSIRKGTTSAADLLGMLPHITYNWFDKSLAVYGRQEILLLVNGVERESNYIKSINPKRIKAVDVVHNPGGRHISDNYAAIVNLLLYDDYIGWDLNLENTTRVKLDRLDSWDGLNKENPSVDYTYTHNSVTVNASYQYDHNRMGILYDEWNFYPGIMENGIERPDDDAPNACKSTQGHKVSAGVDYQISKNHTLSFQGSYSYDDGDVDIASSVWRTTPLSEVRHQRYEVSKANTNRDWIGGVFYKGKIGSRWVLYSDFNYNYYSDDYSVVNIEEDWFSNRYRNHGRKNYTRFNAEAAYTISPKSTLKFGYSTTWKEYVSQERQTNGLETQLDNYRHRVFAYLTHKWSPVWSISLGGVAEWIRDKNTDNTSRHFSFIPDVRVMYKPNRKFDATLQYQGTVSYPTLGQTAVSYRQDLLTSFAGNQTLKQSVCHHISLRARLWNCLTITPAFNYAHNHIAGFYLQTDNGSILNSYVNAGFRTYSLMLHYEKMLFKSLMFSANTTLGRNEIQYQGTSHACDFWVGKASLMYMNRSTGLRFIAEYTQQSRKTPRIQGWERSGESYWMAGAMKTFCKGKMSVMLAYIPPLELGVSKTNGNDVYTDFIRSHSFTHDYRIFKNMFLTRISLRLDHGKRTRKEKNAATTERESDWLNTISTK